MDTPRTAGPSRTESLTAVTISTPRTLATPAPPERTTFRSVMLVLTVTLGMVLNASNATSASIALPRIGQGLDIEENQLQWIVSAYGLSSGCLLLFFGRLADLYGRRRAFILGTLFSSAFGLGCGFAQNEVSIDVFRGLQGVGSAATIPASLGILAHAFPPSRARSFAFATFAAGAPIGATLGMVIGGVLTQETEPRWRSPFFFTAGIGLICFVGALYTIDKDTHHKLESDRRVDWLGAFLVTAGLVLVTFVLSDGEVAPNKWETPYIIALLVLGVLLLVAFFLWQIPLARAADDPSRPKSKWLPPPLLRPDIWFRANGKLAVMMFVIFLNWSCFVAWNFWAQLYYQDHQGLTPILTMVRFLPMFVAGIVANGLVALIVGRVDVVIITAAGTLFTASAPVFFALINTDAPYWAFGFPSAIFSVIGGDFTFAAGTLFVAKVALPHEQSVAGALFNTMSQLGTAFGLTISTIVYDRVRQNNFDGDISAANLKGYRAAQWTCCGFGVLATVLAVAFLRGVGPVGHSQQADEAAGIDDEKMITPNTNEQIRDSRYSQWSEGMDKTGDEK